MVKVQLQYMSGTTAVYQLVEDIETRRFIARDMKKADADAIAALLNAQDAGLAEQAAINRELDLTTAPPPRRPKTEAELLASVYACTPDAPCFYCLLERQQRRQPGRETYDLY